MALQHLRSNTASKRPTPASMADGQLAINTNATSPGVFFKDAGGALIKVGPVHVGTSAPNSSPAAGGSTGNSVGEQWLDTSGGSYVFKVWDGSAWRSEAGEFVDAAGDTMTGDLVMNNANIVFEGSTDDGFETTLTVVDPTADRTITLPNVTGTVVTTGDTGTVTSTMIADGTIVNADVNASAAIAGTKIDPDFGSQTIETTGVFSAAGGSAAAPSITFTGDTNTGIYSPGADQVALSTNGTGRLFVDANGNVGAGTAFPENYGGGFTTLEVRGTGGTAGGIFQTRSFDASVKGYFYVDSSASAGRIGTVTNHPFLFVTSSQERLRIDSSGRLLVGTSSDSGGALLQVNGDRIRVATAKTPASATDTGTTGEICWDADYLYVCTATNTWKRAALSTW